MKKRRDFNIKKLITLSFLILLIGCSIEEQNHLDLSNQAAETLITKAEAMDTGLTQTESYGVELKRTTSDLKVYRYGYFRSLATAKILDPAQKTSTQLLSQRGFSSNDEI